MVQSVPEDGLAILTAGKRDCSYDIEMPIPASWYRRGQGLPLPAPADKASISPQAREQLAAGFDPRVGAAFFDRIPDPGDQFLGSHPANADRKRVVAATVAQLGG